MKHNVLLSLIWINNPFVHKKVLLNLNNRFKIQNTHFLSSHKNNSNYTSLDSTFNELYIHDLYEKYISSDISFPFMHKNNNLIYRFKFNLNSIAERWIRTYNLNPSLTNINYFSNKVLHYWNDYITKNNIDFICINYPHMPHDYAIYIVAYFNKINIYIMHPFFSPFSNVLRYIISTDLNWNKRILSNQKIQLDGDLKIILTNFFSQESNYFKDKVVENTYKLFIQDKKSFFKLNMLKTTRISHIIKKVKLRLKLNINFYKEKSYLSWIANISQSELPSKKFIYFPLHYQPEATTIPAGNLYRDQLEVVREVISYLEEDVILVVKEHPVYWRRILQKNLSEYTPLREVKDFFFYKEIINSDKVYFINHSISSEKLIKMSLGVISITGSVSLESLIFNKPVLLFGEHFYLNLPNVYRATSKNEVRDFLIATRLGEKYIVNYQKTKLMLEELQNNSIKNTHQFKGKLGDEIYTNTEIDENFFKIISTALETSYE